MIRFICYSIIVAALFLLIPACGQSPTPEATVTPKPTAAPTRTGAPQPQQKVQVTAKPVAPQPKQPAAGEPPFYQGKTIELLVGSSAGGGTDTMARFTATYLPRYLPGNPRIIVRNQPSANGVTAANIFFERTKPDGFTLMQGSDGLISLQLMKADVVRYDLGKFRYIGNVARAGNLLTIRKGLKPRLTDPSAEPLVVVQRSAGERGQSMSLWPKEFLGWNVRWIAGFTGTAEMELAFARGEAHLLPTANAFIVRRWINEGIAETLVQTGSLKGGKFVRRPDFPEVPTVEEILGDKKPTGLEWQAYLAWVGPGDVDKYLAAPPGTPDRVVSILTDAFLKMSQDREFIEILKRTVSDVYEVGVGKDTEATVKQILDTPAEALDYNRELQIKHKIISR